MTGKAKEKPRRTPAGERAERMRAERLAQALRANLGRRKAQARERDADADVDADAEAAAPKRRED